jgi:AcrR family transcriptional regulator
MVVRPTSFKKTEPPAEPESSSTKERLLQVAQALFAQKGFHATSTREITRQANTNVASLYFHWRSKENLYLAVYRRLFHQLTQMRQGMLELLEEGLRTHKSLAAVLYPIADRAFEFFAAHPDLARLNLHRMLEGGPLAVKVEQEFENPLYQAAARVYQRLTEEGVIEVSDPEFMPFSLEILLDLYFANPERLQRALGLRGPALRARMRSHFRKTFVRLLAGR